MKLCFFADASNIHTIRWTQYLARNNHEVYIISPSFPHIKDIEGVKIYKIPYYYSINTILLSFPYIKYILKKLKPDILHGIFLSHCGFYASLTGYRPFIGTALGSDVLLAPKLRIRRRAQLKYTLERADVITVDAEILKTSLKKMGYPDSRVKLIYFGVDASLLKQNIKKKNKVLISIRNLSDIYNIDIIIEAFFKIKQKASKYSLIVVGDIEKYPQLHRVDPHIKYIDPMPHNDIIELMNGCEIFVSVPSSDASSVSLLEALALGIFPIVTDLPANREWIKHGLNGLLVSPRNSTDLANKLLEAIQNRELRESSARINRLIIEDKALFQQNMHKLEKIYESLL